MRSNWSLLTSVSLTWQNDNRIAIATNYFFVNHFYCLCFICEVHNWLPDSSHKYIFESALKTYFANCRENFKCKDMVVGSPAIKAFTSFIAAIR